MPTTTVTKVARTLIAAGTSNAAGTGVTRATLDMRTDHGGFLTVKLTNGGALTAQAVVTLHCAHNDGATPAAGAAGADWKFAGFTFAGGTVASAITERSFPIDPAIAHIQVEVTGNTGSAVTCEAFVTEITGYVTA